MSYILDALKRAESERSLGAVPNIHTQLGAGIEPAARGSVVSRLGWGLIVATAVVSAVGAWWWFFADQPEAWNPADASGEVGSPALSAPPFVLPTAPATPGVGKSPTTLAVVPTAPPAREPTAANRASSISPAVVNEGSSPAPRPMVQASSARVVTAAAAADIAASAAAPSPAAEERVYAVKELPDDIRNSLPALTVGGATYSENPANRMLIVNGGIFHEGDKLAPELTLEQIKLRTAVLSFRGHRYSINY